MSASDYEFEEMPSAFLQEIDQIAESQLQTAGGTSSTSAGRASKAPYTSDTIEILTDEDEVTVLPPPRTTSSKAVFRPAKSATTTKPTPPSLPSTLSKYKPSASSTPAPKAGSSADTSIDFDDDWDENVLAELDHLESNSWKAPPVTRQTTLTGEILSNASQAGPSRSTSAHPFGKKAAKTKYWDRTAFSATGKRKGAGKDKRKSSAHDEHDHQEEEMEFEQFPAPFVPLGPAPPMKLKADPDAAQEWVYPLNHPKRDYQYNIVRNSLFENSLVALPTGLGKTFIAGVIMLNYYRWFPEGKVVFVAPTKPLVAQQIEACHHTCGIPRCDTVELTGQIPSSKREVHWRNKRVFFMTPQTLVNDLRTGTCDVMDLVLLVVDEAHRATGGYAYSEVVRYLMAKNPHFRVLALSATPGGKPEAVQEVVDSLHISHIEIRNEDSLDLRQYIHKKDILHTVVPMTGSVNKIKVLLAAAMEPLADKLGKAGIVSIQDVVRLHPYRCQAVLGELGRNGGARQPWAFGTLQKLGKLARAMGYLMEQSVAMCYKSLTGSLDADEQADAAKKKSASGRKAPRLDGDPAVKKVIAEIDAQRRARMNNFPNHPKLDRLLQIALTHFESTPDAESTRVMVFCTFRDCVDEIVEVLNGHSTTLRATRFVGQGVDSSGRKGMAQKDQIELVNQFKQGTYNILVATSIGEEGLDIGEVDLIICYDSQKTPIRMLQRIGRTGRKRNGRIEVLSSAGREEFNYQKAGDSYKDVQDAIVRGEDLELYADVERLLPDEYKPVCAEKVMQIEEFVREEPEEAGGKGRKRKTGAGGDDGVKKRKRKSAGGSLAMDIPEGAAKGFVPVNELIARGAKGKGKATKASPAPSRSRLDEYDPDMIAPEDDDDEDDLPELPVPKSWTQSAASPPSKASTSKLVGFTSAKSLVDKGMDSDEDAEDLPPLKKKLKSSAKGTGAKPASAGKAAVTAKVDKGKGKAKATPPLSELNTTKPSSSKAKAKAPSKRSASPIVIPSSPEAAPPPPKARPPIVKNPSTTAASTASKPAESSGGTDKSMSWLLSDDEDDAPRRPIMMKPGAPKIKPSRPNPPSPTIPLKPKPPQTLGLSRAAGPGTFKVPFAVPRRTPLMMPSGAPVGSSSSGAGELDGLDDPSFELDIPEIPSSKTVDDDSMEVDEEPPAEDLDVDSSFGVRAPGFKRPTAPQRPVAELSSPDVSMSFPVRRAGFGGRLRRGPSRAVPDSDDHDESVVEQPPSFPGHISILDTSIESPAAASPPPRRRRPRKQNQMRTKIGHAMFDMEAGHSGDEVSEGSTCSEGEYETSFVTYGAATQAPEGYDQAAMYRRGLMTQAGPDGPAFAKRPVRYGEFTGGGAQRRGGRISDMSSEVGEYELGSFVVEDDDEMMDVSMDSER